MKKKKVGLVRVSDSKPFIVGSEMAGDVPKLLMKCFL